MKLHKYLSIIMLNVSIVFINIVLFSPGLVSLSIKADSLAETALSLTIMIMSIIIFLLGNYKLFTYQKPTIQTHELETVWDYVGALEQNKGKKTFYNEIHQLLTQIEQLEKKKLTIQNLLLQKFNQSEMSYDKFQSTTYAVEKLFYINIKSIINKLTIFDQTDYERIVHAKQSSTQSDHFIESKLEIYNQYIYFIREAIDDNEQILLKLESLLFELSKFDCLDEGELEKMIEMQEIDELISKAKFYK